MKITRTTDLGQLAEMMGPDATRTDAQRMRETLLAARITDTDELSEDSWLSLIDRLMKGA